MSGLLTPADIQNISQDVLDVQTWANGDSNYDQVFRLGEVVPSPAKLIAGSNIINWTGAWVAPANYSIGDAVEDSGSSYVANTANSGDQPPSANWDLMAAKGTDGAGTVVSVNSGTGISVDNTDPSNPIINSDFASLVDDVTPQLGGPLDPNGEFVGRDVGVTVASASPVVLGTDGDHFSVSGTTNFSAFTVAANRNFTCVFEGVLTITVGAGITLNNGGGNYTTSAGDILVGQSTAANVVTGYIIKADSASPSGGKILQVLSTTKTNTASTTSTVFGNITGLTVAITPSSTSSKILVIVNACTSSNGSSNFYFVRLARDGTAISIGDAAGSRTQASACDRVIDANSTRTDTINYLDAPASVASLTYSIQWRSQTGGTSVYLNRQYTDADTLISIRTASTITVLEIGV